MKFCSQIRPVYLCNFQGRWMKSHVWLYAPFSTTFTSYIFIYMHQRAAWSNYSRLAGLRAARGVKMPCSSIVLQVPQDWGRLLSVPVCLCSAIARHQCEKDTILRLILYFQWQRGAAMIKGSLKSPPPIFIRRLFEEIYSQSLPQSLLCTTNRAFQRTAVDGRINNWHPAWRDTNKHWSEPEALWGK